MSKMTGSFGAVGVSSTIEVQGNFNISLWGTFNATAHIERSFDEGLNWLPCTLTGGGTAEYTAPMTTTVFEPEGAVWYRWNCDAYTDGTINYRISQ